MFIKQLTVFLENRPGSLSEVMGILKDNNLNILSISLADTTEYGLLRMVVSDGDLGRESLKANGFSAMLTDVVGVELENKPGTLHNMLKVISDAGISVEYMYVLASTKVGSMVVKTSNNIKAYEVLSSAGIKVLTNKDILND